jgi:hypothetical protein
MIDSMRIFYDCEFVERGRDLPIQLVSIGLVREDGRELYRINPECLSNVSKHPWLSVNVAPYLPIKASPGILEWDESHPEYQYVSMSLDNLITDVLAFIQDTPDVQLWAYYSAYDHVVLCQLFGSMAELPAGVPMFTFDLQQLIETRPYVALPAEPWKIHHAMDDARWTRDAYAAVTGSDPTPLAATAELSNIVDAEEVEEDPHLPVT